MAFSSGNGRGPMSEINVTPLVDVMLVLLIIFMVAAPMLQTGISVKLPTAQTPAIEKNTTKSVLTITAERKIYLGENVIVFESLEKALNDSPDVQRDKEVYVQADADVPYGFVVQVLAVVRKAGIEKLGLVTDPVGSESR